MKNNKTIENTVHGALMLSIVSSLIIIGLLYFIPFVNTFANLGIPPEIFAPFRLVRILLIVIVVLQFGVLMYKIQSKEKVCPKCQTPLPKWRIPQSKFEAFAGGWTCPNCGTKLDWQLHERK
jgi:hypothetical protein